METVPVTCPFCGEEGEVLVDPAEEGDLVQDCEVCCRPWLVHVEHDEDGAPLVTVEPAH